MKAINIVKVNVFFMNFMQRNQSSPIFFPEAGFLSKKNFPWVELLNGSFSGLEVSPGGGC